MAQSVIKKQEEQGAISGKTGLPNQQPTGAKQADLYKQQWQANQQNAAQQNPGAYVGLEGVSQNTAQKVGQFQNGYQQGDAVTAAQQQLQQIMDQKPQGFTSKYGPQLDNILQQITNPEKFQYSFNGDEMFKNYADVYTQKAKQAAADTMGQAAALTGGYGNSYAQAAANQQYQQALLPLYDRGMELYDRAYGRYKDQQQGLMDQFGVLQDADQTAYGRHRDEVGDWQGERDYFTGRADTEAERDFSRFANERDYYTGLAQVENADYRNDQERQEAIRQYEQNFAENQRQFDLQMAENRRQFEKEYEYKKMSDDKKYAFDYAYAILQNGKMPSDAILKQAGLSREDAQKIMKQVAAAGGGRGGSSGKGNTYYTMNDQDYYDLSSGKPVKVDYDKISGNQNNTYVNGLTGTGSILGSYAANAALVQKNNLQKKK